jgi:lipid-A-disaccharide synthase
MAVKRADNYFISAGEVSGDLLAADLVLALRERLPKLQPFGVTGPAMRNSGVESVVGIEAFSVMGVADVIRKIPDLKLVETRLLAWVDQMQPRFAVLVDNPGFHLRFAEQLRMRGVKVFQYVAPKIWAWGEGRAPRIREAYDLVLGILPFEEDFFRKRQVNYTYVGSPLKDRIDKVIVNRKALGLPDGRPVVACLPGSRAGEVRRIMPILQSIRNAVARELKDPLFVVPMAPNLEIGELAQALGHPSGAAIPMRAAGGEMPVDSWSLDGFRVVRGMSLELMAAADVAIVASGTATLECALLGTPMVVVYSMGEFSYQIARRAVRVNDVSLVNLMAGRRLVQEYIQDVAPDVVATEIVTLINDPERRRAMCERFEDIRDRLKGAAAETAATAIAATLDGARPAG